MCTIFGKVIHIDGLRIKINYQHILAQLVKIVDIVRADAMTRIQTRNVHFFVYLNKQIIINSTYEGYCQIAC